MGENLIWSVNDNGEGAGAAPDDLSYFYSYAAAECANQYPFLVRFAWTQGNVQVR